MYRILSTDGMAKSAVQKLKDLGYEVVEEFYEPEVLAEKVKEFDALVVRSATKVREPIIDAAASAGKLKIIIRGGVGVDNIDVAYAKEKGIAVANTPNASSASVAELAITHMLALARFVSIANVTMRNGQWEKKAYKGVELTGKTLGVFGMGRIGRETAKRAEALGMKVIYTDAYPVSGVSYEKVEQDELLKRADFITFHIPAIKGQPPIVNKEFLAKMKDGAYLINTARGALVDEEALCDALDSGKLAGAGLDVYNEEPSKNERLLHHPKVSMTPHIGGTTKEAQDRIGEEIVEIIKNTLK
ncbi:MAG: D-2-hydroxyacid dehydrogenase [Clostridiales bacterium]|nr:D-2-hydroxyacid dehydrogenase [Clostridiales bacterium]